MFKNYIPFNLCVVAVLIAGCRLSGAEKAMVNGTVTDPSGAVVVNAQVTLHQVTGSAVLRANCDKQGKFSFEDVAAGDYLLDASAPGLSAAEVRSVHVDGESQTVPIRLVASTVKTQISVTAADAPQSVDQVSKALDVVTAESAEQRGIFSVADAIRFVPGLRVSEHGGPGSFTTIQTRGLRVTDTAVLIDGFPFRDVTSVHDEASAFIGDLMMVDTSRIEVLRGSGSSLYGSNSMSGTVNIITDAGGGPLHGDVDVQGGGLGLFRGLAQMTGGVKENRLTYSAGVSRLDVTRGVDDAGAVRGWSGHAGVQYALTPSMHAGVDFWGNSDFLQLNVSPQGSLAAPLTGIIPAIPLSYSQMKLADQNLLYTLGNATFVPSLGDPDAGRYSHFINSLFRFDQELNPRLSYRIAYGISSTDRNNTDGPGGPDIGFEFQPLFNTSDRYAGRLDTLQARLNYDFNAHQILTAGYEFSQEQYLNVTSDQNPDLTARVYDSTQARQRFQSGDLQDQIRLLRGRVQILLSGRITGVSLDAPRIIGGTSPYSGTSISSPDNAYTGDASLSYLVARTATKLRAHAGNSYRTPSIYERFGGYFYGGAYFAAGDPRLSPERAVSGDFGFDQYLWHEHLKVSATYFYSHLQQVIGFLDFPPGYVDPYGRTGGYYNTGGGTARGVEISGEFKPARSTTVNASYVHTNSQDRVSEYYTGTGVDPLQTPRILPNEVKIVAMQQIGKRIDVAADFDGGSPYLYPIFGFLASGSTAYRFDGPRQLGLSAGYTVPVSERSSARVYVRVYNTLDQDYYEDGFRTPHRWASGGVRFTF